MNAVLKLVNVCKTFYSDGKEFDAVKNVSLEIQKGEIFGIIGLSGAGKSTLIRCMNRLETPTSGDILIDGESVLTMKGRQLRQLRKKVTMIFQQFNLLMQSTVAKNVRYPLELAHVPRAKADARVKELLEIVGLADKADAYPAQLSGGQKQRVAIARALASDPEVLLCDEATSALDPMTTQSILSLLQDINRRLGITIVIITHEMAVVKEICTDVAVMENGEIVERGALYDVFSRPQAPITRRFIETTEGAEQLRAQLRQSPKALGVEPGDTVVVFSFHGESSGRALVSSLSREFDIDISILYGNVEMLAGKPLGKLITVIRGEEDSVRRALQKISGSEVDSEVLEHV